MASKFSRLPLNALRVFEAVASHLNFAAAADRLDVTPAAVSQQVQALESYLQLKLFVRRGRRVELTPEGVELLPGVRRALAELQSSIERTRQLRSGGPLHVSLLSSFLQSWMLPRVRTLQRAHPDLVVRFHTSREPVNFGTSPVHAAIRFGRGPYGELHADKVLDEWVVPVATAELLKCHGRLTRASDLAHVPLLDNEDEPWRAWSGQQQAESLWRARTSAIDDSAGLLAAAEEGLGYALARWSLVVRSLQRRTLELASDEFMQYSRSYHFVCPAAYLALPKVVKFRDWLLAEARAFPSPAQWLARRGG